MKWILLLLILVLLYSFIGWVKQLQSKSLRFGEQNLHHKYNKNVKRGKNGRFKKLKKKL